MKKIGRRLRELREDQKMSQTQLSEIFGKSQSAIGKYENETLQLDYEMINKYAQYFHVSTDYLLGRTEEPNEYYLSADNYPDVLKPFIFGNKSSLSFIAEDAKGNETDEEKKQTVEDFLKSTNALDCGDSAQSLLSLLPESWNGKPISLYDLYYAIGNNKTLLGKLRKSGFDNNGELTVETRNDIKQKSKPTAKSDEPAYLPNNCTPISEVPMIPVVGNIAAGAPILAQENIIGYLPTDVKNPEEYFYLHVEGDSMINAGIENDSDVLIRKQNCADNGQIVACFVNGDSATLKRFKQLDDTVFLMPENTKYEPIIVKCGDFESGYARILGVAVEAVTRKRL